MLPLPGLFLGTLDGRVVRTLRTPRVLDLVLRMGFRLHYFFDDGSMIGPALVAAGLLRGREGAAALALDHDALGTPPVDFAHRYVLDLVMRFDVLYDLRHFFPRFPFPASAQRKNDLPLYR
jgi:hypothetical protein